MSSTAQWTTTNSPVLTVGSTGLATGKDRGESSVTARFGGRSAGAPIFVLPRGTFRLAGTIRESGFGIAGVAVTVISGVGEGLTTLSGSTGSYVFYGVSGPVQLRAKKEGYFNAVLPLDVTAPRTYDFEMAPERARGDYRGSYALTISAPSCRTSNILGPFPDTARRRVYTANVTQEGPRLTVTLSDADFIVTNGRGNSFVGFVDTTEVIRLSISDAYVFGDEYISGHFDIVERFNDTALVVAGTASVGGTPALLSGTLSGSILIARSSPPPFTSFSSSCYSENHAFEMVRR
ncbi:MAG TPA: carboxypeptidase-like regulatory domain-containing protein [Vicinamibacterales bacterium]|nr:carboxypeptidase-like regulatory domain-containing protein [Vicinamibacterales bacterium]